MLRWRSGLGKGDKAALVDRIDFRDKNWSRFQLILGSDITDHDKIIRSDMPLVHEFETSPDIADALTRFSSLPKCLLLESARQTKTGDGKPLGRYSFLMADPIESIRCESVNDAIDALAKIDALLSEYSSPTIDGLPPMQGGVAGMFSYDLNRAFENIAAPATDEFETPLIAVGLYDVVLAWDHEAEKAWLISQGWSRDAGQRTQSFLNLLQSDSFDADDEFSGDDLAKIDNQHEVPGPAGLTSNFSQEDYLAAVNKAIEYIYAGDIFQVNLAQRLLQKAECSGVDLYKRLRHCNPAPFGGYFDFGGGQLISASPERLVSIRNGLVETRPIKGTRSRTGQPIVDINASRKLEASEKDRAENTMIVDLMRNDLSRICTDDSVKVTQFCEIENYQSVMHLVSAIEARLKDDRCSTTELMRAIFPGGSITGAPKVRAMEIIAELEPNARGAYCGSLGYFGADGSVDLNILIRTITASRGWWQIPVGGGIVNQSVATSEYDETWSKAAGMLTATSSARSVAE